jgi:RNA polymerase sigma-70 factor (ECF subfamily)
MAFLKGNGNVMVTDSEFEMLVTQYYQPLYRFALSLTGAEAEAGDLTQQTFYVLETKNDQLRDRGKIKSWLFTTLHRQFLNSRRHQARFPHFDLDSVEAELPSAQSQSFDNVDAEAVLEALKKVEEPHQAAVALFYLEDYSYLEIAEILGTPVGTVKSRISRGIAQLKHILLGSNVNTLTPESKYHG